MDSQYSNVHLADAVLVDIVDDEWRADELPADETVAPEEHLKDLPPLDEEDDLEAVDRDANCVLRGVGERVWEDVDLFADENI